MMNSTAMISCYINLSLSVGQWDFAITVYLLSATICRSNKYSESVNIELFPCFLTNKFKFCFQFEIIQLHVPNLCKIYTEDVGDS